MARHSADDVNSLACAPNKKFDVAYAAI